MSTTPPVLLSFDGKVGLLTLNRPTRLNALTPTMLDLLTATLTRAVDEGARALVLTGAGRAFCAGADLAANDEPMAGSELGGRLREHYNPVIETMAALPIPIVTAVNGAAAGAGASIALAGDIIVAARSAYFLLAFANIGLVPDAGSTWLISQSAGRQTILEMALLGERVTASKALDAGLINRVEDDEDMLGAAMALGRKLAEMPSVALGLIRKQVAFAQTATLSETMEMEAQHQSIAAQTADFREGVAAFLEKRPAVFEGH